MAWSTAQSLSSNSAWKLVADQHGVVARRQLLELGLSARAIEHRIATGRLRLLVRGVYVVGRSELSREGRWMAAVLACGEEAVLSYGSAATLWEIGAEKDGKIDISVPASSFNRPPGIRVHRCQRLRLDELCARHQVPVTCPVRTLIDLATELDSFKLERAINEADKHDLITPDALRTALGAYGGQSGVRRLRTVLDRRTFRMTDSDLERYFLPIADQAGLPRPLTQRYVNGFKVDFFWPDLGLVIETDGLRYHRTPAEQARDRLRDQTHTAAGLTQLRFSHAQVKYEPAHVRKVLAAVARRLDLAVDA